MDIAVGRRGAGYNQWWDERWSVEAVQHGRGLGVCSSSMSIAAETNELRRTWYWGQRPT